MFSVCTLEYNTCVYVSAGHFEYKCLGNNKSYSSTGTFYVEKRERSFYRGMMINESHSLESGPCSDF